MIQLIDLFLHLDKYLNTFVQQYHFWVYVLLFIVIFIETGVVVFPFLPGDSLLFTAGALAGAGIMDVWIVFVTLALAAILGDTLNYWIGHSLGRFAHARNYKRIVTPQNLAMTEEFYKKHGKNAIILARFVPIIRTIVPFIAGVGKMKYSQFFIYNVVGGIIWTALFIFAGFFFGNIPIVKQQLHWVILGIIVVSLIPIVWKIAKKYLNK